MKLLLITLTCSIGTIIACKSSDSPNVPENTNPVFTTVASVESPSAEAESNTIDYDNDQFPDIDSFTTKVLRTGVFHEEEVWPNAEQGDWYGLFLNDGQPYIAPTQLTTKRVRDEIVDMDDMETGWEVKTTNDKDALLLIEGKNYLTVNKVHEMSFSKTQFYPNEDIEFVYSDIHYKIFATGENVRTAEAPEWLQITNYKLFITASINGKEHKSLLVAQPGFDETMINIIFAGDMDGDGILDLIIDTSNHYNASVYTLYLSKQAGAGELMKPIGAHATTGC